MNRRLLLLAAGLVLALAATDFLRRVHVGRDSASREFRAPEAVAVPSALTPDRVRGDLASWLPALAPELGQQAGAEVGAPAEWTLTLLGIFADGRGRVAVLRADQAGGAASERLGLRVGDDVHGLRVTDIGRTSVSLERDGAAETLRLFDRESEGTDTIGIAGVTAAGSPAAAAPPPAAAQLQAVVPQPAAPQSGTLQPGPAPGATPPPSPAVAARPSRTATQPVTKGVETQTPQQVEPGAPIQLPWNLPMSNPEEFAKEAAAAGAAPPPTPTPTPTPTPPTPGGKP